MTCIEYHFSGDPEELDRLVADLQRQGASVEQRQIAIPKGDPLLTQVFIGLLVNGAYEVVKGTIREFRTWAKLSSVVERIAAGSKADR